MLSHVSVTPNFNYSKLLYAGAHLIKASLMAIAFETTELLTFFKPANSTWTHYTVVNYCRTGDFCDCKFSRFRDSV